MDRIIIAAPNSGSGKTSISLGLMRALKNRGLKVQPFKVGPDYIDPAFHGSASGRVSRNLDLWLMPEAAVKACIVRHAADADIALIEGVMGLYDGLGHSLDNGSTAHVARVLETPVVLVVDAKGMSTSAAALVKGFRDLDPRVNLAGVLLNQVRGEKMYTLLREGIEAHTGVPCLGYVEPVAEAALESRHLGLVPSVETDGLEHKLELLAEAVAAHVDLERLLRVASAAPELTAPSIGPLRPGETVHVGIARDEAFNFYYQDNLDLLEAMGVQWVPFSPLRDSWLPPGLAGLYFGGGFPEVFAERLEQNQGMRGAVRTAALGGMPVFAECGGYMYLMDSIRPFDGTVHGMCGVVPGQAVMTRKLQRFGYVKVRTAQDSLFGPKGTELKGHEFHRSVHEGDIGLAPAYELSAGRAPEKSWTCGTASGNLLAAYAHIHFSSNPDAAAHFVKKCRAYAAGE